MLFFQLLFCCYFYYYDLVLGPGPGENLPWPAGLSIFSKRRAKCTSNTRAEKVSANQRPGILQQYSIRSKLTAKLSTVVLVTFGTGIFTNFESLKLHGKMLI